MLKTYSEITKKEDDAKKLKKETLLEMALSKERDVWNPGEKIILWRSPDPTKRAYLVEDNGIVSLVLSSFPDDACIIFEQDVLTSFWDISENLNEEYVNWSERIRSKIRNSQQISRRSRFANAETKNKLPQLKNEQNKIYRSRRQIRYEKRYGNQTVQPRAAR